MPYIHRIHPEIIRFTDTIAIRWYGLSYLLGFLFGYLLLKVLIRRKLLHLSVEQLQDCLTTFCIFGILLGGRIGYFIFYDFSSLLENPLRLLQVWKGGMASHGGIIGGILALAWWARRNKVSFWHLTDNFATVVPLGLAFGRIANFINGELWGRVTTVPWGMVFPLELRELHPDGPWAEHRYNLDVLRHLVANGQLQPRHPSQLYQACAEGFLLFGLMWFLRQRPWSSEKPGRLSIVFLLGYALARFSMEFFREPDAHVYFGWMSTGQLLTLFMVAGAALCAFLPRKA